MYLDFPDVLTLVLLPTNVLALSAKLVGWPEMRVPQTINKAQGLRISKHWFVGYESSKDLCQDFNKQWWARYIRERLSPVFKTQLFLKVGFEVPDPLEKYLVTPPVQAIGARVLSKRARNSCVFYCEDLRPALELYINHLAGERQVRDKGELHMRCESGFEAVVEFLEDEREPETGLHDLFDAIVATKHTYSGPSSYPSSFHNRKIGQKVANCVCKPSLWAMYAQSESFQRSLAPSSSTLCEDITARRRVASVREPSGLGGLPSVWPADVDELWVDLHYLFDQENSAN